MARPRTQEPLFSNGFHQEENGTSTGWDKGVVVDNNTPTMMLKCADCGICKNNSEDMEIHIKMEHLNWLPFQCPVCSCQRASDAQMREHMHSSHRSTATLFHYADNVSAKRRLQILMDKSLSHAINKKVSNGRANNYPIVNEEASDDSASGSPGGLSPLHSATVSVLPRKRPASIANTNTDALLASIVAATDPSQEDKLNEIDWQSLSNPLFSNKRIKSEMDVDEENVIDGSSMLEALFTQDNDNNELFNSFTSVSNGKANRERSGQQSVSKKRVLGECSKCQKPVTAGARQMHMFYHLGKDHNIYRFRCKYDGCTVEHYRKDQMENHHSKQHGKIDPDMMEDRSLELFTRCQELSMELLGTNGSTPGPTAARALVAYNAQHANQAPKSRSRKSKPEDGVVANGSTTVMIDEHPLECKLCHKTMQNRIRGFHILWHMAKDLGINRYTCKMCDFGHDRSQSVQTHGKREHGREDIVEDRIDEYTEEVKQMSQACFGFQALFSQDSRRRSKIPLAPAREKIDGEVKEEVDDGGSENDENVDDEDGHDVDERIDDGDEESTAKRSSSSGRRQPVPNRRFGIRKVPNKTKRMEMAKLREVSMTLGGAQYFKKRVSEAAHCEKCGQLTQSRMSDHVYKHLAAPLFLCPHCDMGHTTREIVVRHLKDYHRSTDAPVDQRLKYAQEIKDMVRECYPAFFVDAPIPTAADMEKLKSYIGVGEYNKIIAGDTDGEEEKEEEAIEEMEEPVEEVEGEEWPSPKEEEDEGEGSPPEMIPALDEEEMLEDEVEDEDEEDEPVA